MTWLAQFNDDLKADQTPGPRAFVLATVAADGTPRARNVILRRVTDDGGLVFTSDGRSEKNTELRINPDAAVCFWLIDQRLQWRLRGVISFEVEPLRSQVWSNLPDSARALFTWPAAGEAFDASANFPQAVPADAPMPAAFEVLTLRPQSAERLDLRPHPHARLQWNAGTAEPMRINP